MLRRELLIGGGAVALGACTGAPPAKSAPMPSAAPPPARPGPVAGVVERGALESGSRFEFWIGSWLNLHHVLHELGKKVDPSQWRAPGIEKVETVRLEPAEAEVWNAAVTAYGGIAASDPVFDQTLAELHIALTERGSLPDLGNVAMPGDLRGNLEAAMPIYKKHWWREHLAASMDWLGIAKILDPHEDDMAVDLARWLHDSWPAEATRVSLCAYTNWAGAYSTLGPTRLYVGTIDERNQGPSGVEVLFHEASHALIRPAREAITAQAKAKSKNPRDLWHVVLFVTAGELVRRRFPGYVPYGARLGLYDKGPWKAFHAAVAAHWQPYLDGKVEFDAAIASLVGALPD